MSWAGWVEGFIPREEDGHFTPGKLQAQISRGEQHGMLLGWSGCDAETVSSMGTGACLAHLTTTRVPSAKHGTCHPAGSTVRLDW